MKNLALRYFAHLSLVAASLVIVMFAWAMLNANARSSDAARVVAHTLEVARSIDDLDGAMGRAESAQRGYLLTGMPSFLRERDERLTKLATATSKLKKLTENNPAQQQRTLRIQQLTAERVSDMQANIRRVREKGVVLNSEADYALRPEAGLQIEALTEEMKRDELGLLEMRLGRQRDQNQRTLVILVIAFLTSMLILLPGCIGFAAQLRKRKVAEKKLSDMADSLPGAVYQCRTYPEDKARERVSYQFISRSVLSVLGLERKSVMRDAGLFAACVFEEDLTALLAAAKDSERTLAPLDQSFRVRLPSGEMHWIRSTASVVAEPDGSLLWNGYWADITESKRLERMVKDEQMEGRYRGLLEAAPDAMVVVNESGKIVLLNVQAEKQFGYSRHELVGQAVNNIIPHGFEERLIADGTRSAAEALAQQIGTGIELSGRRKDGSAFPLEIMLSPLEADEGVLVTAAIRDISVRKQVEQHMAQMEARYRGLLEAAPDAMVVVDQAGEIVLLNVQAEKQFGYSRDELLKQQVTNIIPEGFAERLIADGTRTASEALAQQIGTGIELVGRRKDGSGFPIEIMLSPSQSEDGVLVTAAIRDISMRKAEELQKDAAEASNRAKDVFLATMSHEIRTPMNGLLGMLELLSLTALDASQHATLNVVRESGKSLQRIIDDILDFSKMEAGKLDVRAEATSVAYAVEAVRNIYSGNASERGVVLRCVVDPAISPAVMVDPMRLRQILNNLVSNALKFTAKGHVEIKAQLLDRIEEGKDTVRFSVSDTGIGISQENQARMFQPFFQVATYITPRHGGTGLGLSICQRLARMMGGTISIISEPDVGTTMEFTLSLPVVDAEVTVDTEPLSLRDWLITSSGMRRAAPTTEQACNEGTLVLLADDHPINRSLLVRQVNALGYAAESAMNGLEALEMWKSGRFSVLITDGNMPGMDGYELARAIRTIESTSGAGRTPILACTANVLGGAMEACLASGMDDYIAKPVDLKELAKKLDHWAPIPHFVSAMDPTVLAAFSDGDAAAESEVLVDFRRVNDIDVASLECAVDSSDLPDVKRAVHRIKGASATIGAKALVGVCVRMEQAIETKNWAGIDADMKSFRREVARLNTHLESEQWTLPS